MKIEFRSETQYHDVLERFGNVVIMTLSENDLSCELVTFTNDTVDEFKKKFEKKKQSPKAYLGYIGDKVVPFYFKM
jgi:hypothetical protein